MTPFDHAPPASPQGGESGSPGAARRGGHGSEKRQRGVPFSLRLLPEERAAIEQNASAVGLSLGSYARACMLMSPARGRAGGRMSTRLNWRRPQRP